MYQPDLFSQPSLTPQRLAEREFVSDAPINTKRLGGQNLRLFNYLLSGNRINVFSQAKRDLGIGYLNSRASDLQNLHNIPVEKRYILTKDIDGNDVTVKEYWLSYTTIQRIKKQF